MAVFGGTFLTIISQHYFHYKLNVPNTLIVAGVTTGHIMAIPIADGE
jgi:hypothetical protein